MKILISGAGIAGLTLAWWLNRAGHEPVIVEKRNNPDDAGFMIDFYGSGFDVAEKMGLIDRLKERHYSMHELIFVNRQGRRLGAMNIDKFRKLLNYRHYNFLRGDLESVLYASIKDKVQIRFGTTITSINSDEKKVQAVSSDNSQWECDLLIGADGIHSHVRRLALGIGSECEKFLGYYVVCGIIDNILDKRHVFLSRLEPGVQVAAYSIDNNRLATFITFKSSKQIGHDREARVSELKSICKGMKWVVPELVAETVKSPEFYFDAVSQVQLSAWHKGRIGLVGDACQCLTLLAGQGASMAMAGAYYLAEKLEAAGGNFQKAFTDYENLLKPEIETRQAAARKLAGSFVPESWFSIGIVLLFMRFLFFPGFRRAIRRQVGAGSIIH